MKPRFSIYSVLFAITLAIFSCNDDKEPAEVTIVDAPVDSLVSLNASDRVYISWDEFYKKNDITFSLDSFLKADTITGELYTISYTPSPEYFENFGNLLVYNEDSSKFIDAFSSSWIIEKGTDGKLHAREGEIDQEVTIVNKKEKIRTRLFFCGPGCMVQKVFWYNEDVVGIMGLMAEYADEYYTPTIWFVNIHNGITIPYQYSSSVSIVHANDYIDNYIESRGIKVDY